MKQVLALLFLVTQVAQCETIEVTESQNVIAQIGDTIIIKLKENPTTGYSWQMDFSNTDVAELQENTYVAPDGKLIGAGGERQCIIKAEKIGTVIIEGKYIRRWEKNIPPVRNFKCTITVK